MFQLLGTWFIAFCRGLVTSPNLPPAKPHQDAHYFTYFGAPFWRIIQLITLLYLSCGVLMLCSLSPNSLPLVR